MAMQKMVVGTALAVVVVLMTAGVLALLSVNRTLTTTGTIGTVNVGVYSDANCTVPVSSLVWGTVEPGASPVETVYVKNLGTVTETLNMTSNAWTPSACSSYMTLTWDAENASVTVGNAVKADFTLTISSSVTGITSFSFNIVVTGTG
jgi:hypothetical protein